MIALIFYITSSHQKINKAISARQVVTPDRDVGSGGLSSNLTEINRINHRTKPMLLSEHHHPHSLVYRLNKNCNFIHQLGKQDLTYSDHQTSNNENRDTKIRPCPFYCMACRDIVQSDKVVMKGVTDADSINGDYVVDLCKHYQPHNLLQLDNQKFKQDQMQKNINETNTPTDNIYPDIQNQKLEYQYEKTPKAYKNELKNNHEHKKSSFSVFKKIKNIYKFINSKPEWILCGFAFIGIVQLCIMIYLVFRF